MNSEFFLDNSVFRCYNLSMKTPEETRQQILNAAEQRFRHYGFSKTTMAEIAEDCDMSAANIYRFFASKDDIIAEMANIYFTETENSLREIVRRKGLTAGERLEAFILETLYKTYDMFANQPKLNECCMHIDNERFELVTRHKEIKQSLIAEIVAEGNKTGEFDTDDIVTTADTIEKTLILFAYPEFMHKYSLEELERTARGVVNLLVRGLEKR